MVVPLRAIVLSLLAIPSAALNVPFASYDNDFIEPGYILGKDWSATTVIAQESIVQWADWLAIQGPWSVTTSKPFPVPSNNPHDYLSWAPYVVWVTCPYVHRDGEVNPDVRTVNNTGAFNALADAVLYNTLAWVINSSSQYATNVANWINTWFLARDTYMKPNLNYARIVRGPKTSKIGRRTGVLDLRCMVKIVNAVLVLRAGNAPGWTSAIDSGQVAWAKSYIRWLTTGPLALAEAAATKCVTHTLAQSNHGSYYYGQLAALQILVYDGASANPTIQKYFSTVFRNQVNGTGEQLLEAVRTRPYHYRLFNLAAMITNAHLGFDAWNLPSATGGTIQSALDFVMAVPAGGEDPKELYPSVGAGGAVYGDHDPWTGASYSVFLANAQPNYPADPWFFWDQPLSDSGWVRAQAGGATSASPAPSGTTSAGAASQRPPAAAAGNGKGKGKGKNDGARVLLGKGGWLFLGAATSVLLHVLLLA